MLRIMYGPVFNTMINIHGFCHLEIYILVEERKYTYSLKS